MKVILIVFFSFFLSVCLCNIFFFLMGTIKLNVIFSLNDQKVLENAFSLLKYSECHTKILGLIYVLVTFSRVIC